MRRFLAVFIAAMVSFACRSLWADGAGELLWWMISDVDGITASDDKGNIYSANELGVNSARVRYDSQTGESGYLTLWGLDENGQFFQEQDSMAGVGIPSEYYGSLSDLSGDSASYSFVIELGNWSNGSWTKTSMESQSVSYADLLKDKHIASWDDLTPLGAYAWSPSQYHVVPEPNSALLILLGVAALSLRRRRFKRE